MVRPGMYSKYESQFMTDYAEEVTMNLPVRPLQMKVGVLQLYIKEMVLMV